ncbi:MAG: DUF4870 domain-containing protein [Ancrocorticia sp.]
MSQNSYGQFNDDDTSRFSAAAHGPDQSEPAGDAWSDNQANNAWNDNTWAGQPFDSQQPYGGQPYDQSYNAYNGQPYGQEGAGYNSFGEPIPGQGNLSADDDKVYAILAALSGPAAMLLSMGWLAFAGPLILWFLFKDRSPYARAAAARAFNFQLGMTVASIVAWLLLVTVILIPVSFIIWIAVFVLSIYYPIQAVMAASRYESYNYPFSLPVLN